jgi:hypothetical protein
MNARIGVAETAPRNGRADRYTVYAVNPDGTVSVEYSGYREGSVLVGLPLGGPGWRPPTRHTSRVEHFATITFLPGHGSDENDDNRHGGRHLPGISQGQPGVEGRRVVHCTGRRGTLVGDAYSTYGATVQWDDGNRYYTSTACLWWAPETSEESAA